MHHQQTILDKAARIHLIGIGGIGMSGLARLFLTLGKHVSGSDREESPLTADLRAKGIMTIIGQKEENITPDIEAVVFTQAIPADNPEYRKAAETGIPLVSYPEALGFLMRKKRGVAVAGTHGKTTTSALIVTLLAHGRLSPSFVIGGEILGRSNSGVGDGDILVVEACEYKRSFLNYEPEIAVITNIEEDHLDYYRDLADIKGAFRGFCANVKKNGLVIACAEDANSADVTRGLDARVVTYGIRAGTWRAGNIKYAGNGTTFTCRCGRTVWGDVRMALRGRHNVLNGLAAVAAGAELGIPASLLKKGLTGFTGVRRRCELLGKVRGVTVIDDYGHHPTEIRATLAALRERFPDNRLIVVFQPHQYSRTRFLLKDFAASFLVADKVVVPDIYFVRDSAEEQKLVNAQILVDHIRENGQEALYLPTFTEIVAYLKEIIRRGDVVLTIGAGPVNQVGNQLLREMQRV